jgi:hypothetical protein
MTTHNPDDVQGPVEGPDPDGAASHNGRLSDAVRTIKDAAEKLSERIRLPSSGTARNT